MVLHTKMICNTTLVNGETTLIQVDYNNLPIRCRYCLSTSHQFKIVPKLEGKNGHKEVPISLNRGLLRWLEGIKGKN